MRKVYKSLEILIRMASETINIKAEDLAQIKRDLQLIKRAVLPEQELTDWAKKQLEKSLAAPESEFISHEKVKEMIRSK